MSACWWFGLFIPAVFSVLALRTTKFLFKALVTASCIFLICLLLGTSGMPFSPVLPLLAALAASIIGDAFLSFRKGHETFYLYGILCFFGAHAAYLAYALARPNQWVPAIILLLAMVLVFSVYYRFRLVPHIAGIPMKVAMYAYILISCATFAFTATADAELPGYLPLTAGIGLILFSDFSIGETDFTGNQALTGWILPTYYLSHMLLTASIFAGIAGH